MNNDHRTLVTIRMVEERLLAMCRRGEAGDLHFSKGQEAISVGVMAALRPTDWVVTHHRTISHSIARGADLYRLLAEVLGKRTGVNGGRAGEMHLHDERTRHAFSFQLVGTSVPVAAGLAWAQRHHHGTDDVVACFFGDAASSNGTVHEGLTIAAVQKVPVLYVCENNGLAGNVTQEHYLPTRTVAERMRAYGIGAETVDGNDVAEVRDAATQLVGYVRERGSPMLLECSTTRLCMHKVGQGDVRSKEEIAELARRDPLNAIPATERAVLEVEVGAVLDALFERVAADPPPEWRS